MAPKIATVLHEHRIVGDATNRFGLYLSFPRQPKIIEGELLVVVVAKLAEDLSGVPAGDDGFVEPAHLVEGHAKAMECCGFAEAFAEFAANLGCVVVGGDGLVEPACLA